MNKANSKRKIRLKCGFTLGDLVVLSGALRDLHRAYPGQFLTSVDTGFQEIWRFNPYVTNLGWEAETIDCNAVAVDRQGVHKRHYIHAYLDLLNRHLGTQAAITEIKGDVHLSRQERNWYSDIWSLCGKEIPYWIICAGGKFDIPVKWWDHRRYQEVVDYFRGKIQFVQVGTWGHHHPKIEGAIDLRGKTNVRDLVHLVYNARGVLCGVTSLMHLAAAVPTPLGRDRMGVIIGGAREPAVWETYPGHEFISTENSVPCARCWKDRYEPLPDGPAANKPSQRCFNVSNSLPACMDLISTSMVIERLEKLRREGRLTYLTSRAYSFARKALDNAEKKNNFESNNITLLNSRIQADRFIQSIRPYPARKFNGRGIILCGGGVKYFTNAWVCINILRLHGCKLPIQLWHLGRHELDRRMESLLAPFGVECINAREVMNRYPMRNPLGWELKSYALLHCPYKEVLFLDSDNVPVRNPEFLFETPEYKKTGAIFWPDYGRLGPKRPIWNLCGIPWRDEPEVESGQLVINKEKGWRPMNLAFWYNDHSEFFYRFVHGDKETFHLAWRKLNVPYAMPPFPIHPLEGTMCQHDFSGKILFQHRNLQKWQFFGDNPSVPGFAFEKECLQFIEQLRKTWDGKINGRRETIKKFGFEFRNHTSDYGIFRCVAQGNEYCLPPKLPAEGFVIDIGAHIGSFALACWQRGSRRILCFEPDRQNCELARANLRRFPGVKVENAAVLDRNTGVDCQPYPNAGEEQNTGGGAVFHNPSGVTPAFPLDVILRKAGKVSILKLDCEGSEWPILLHSEELWRVGWLCGEYHLREAHALCPEIKSPLDRELLKVNLKRNFRYVRTIPDKVNPFLGRFWASHSPLDLNRANPSTNAGFGKRAPDLA